jgi:pimeloyl-ACP methyl ester carboxylesterase
MSWCRGVARTVPTMRVFKSQAEITTFTVQTNDDPALGTSPDAIGRTLAHYKQAGLLTKARASDIAPYLTTALVCRDMLGVVRAHGRDKLLFFGQSYGAIIGEVLHAGS